MLNMCSNVYSVGNSFCAVCRRVRSSFLMPSRAKAGCGAANFSCMLTHKHASFQHHFTLEEPRSFCSGRSSSERNLVLFYLFQYLNWNLDFIRKGVKIKKFYLSCFKSKLFILMFWICNMSSLIAIVTNIHNIFYPFNLSKWPACSF